MIELRWVSRMIRIGMHQKPERVLQYRQFLPSVIKLKKGFVSKETWSDWKDVPYGDEES